MQHERMIAYDFGGEIGAASFVPRCTKCGRYVKPGLVRAGVGGIVHEPNAICKHCGPVEMEFIGFF